MLIYIFSVIQKMIEQIVRGRSAHEKKLLVNKKLGLKAIFKFNIIGFIKLIQTQLMFNVLTKIKIFERYF